MREKVLAFEGALLFSKQHALKSGVKKKKKTAVIIALIICNY